MALRASVAFRAIAAAGLPALAAAACLGTTNLRRAPLSEGKVLVVARGLEEALAAARAVLGELGYTVNDDYTPEPGTRVLLASAPGEGELLDEARLVARAHEMEEETTLTVLCRRVLPAQVRLGGEDCADRILGLVGAELAPPPAP